MSDVTCPSCGHHFEPRVEALRKMNIEHLMDVAEVYDRHVHTGKPTQAVQLEFQTSWRTAARWVAMARDAGLVMAPRQKGGRPSRVTL